MSLFLNSLPSLSTISTPRFHSRTYKKNDDFYHDDIQKWMEKYTVKYFQPACQLEAITVAVNELFKIYLPGLGDDQIGLIKDRLVAIATLTQHHKDSLLKALRALKRDDKALESIYSRFVLALASVTVKGYYLGHTLLTR